MVRPGDNPFRSARVDALGYRFIDEDEDEATIRRRWEAAGRRGAVIGPHGHGKTTLTLRLAPDDALRFQVHADDASNRAELRKAVRHFRGVLVIDGYDLLGPIDQWRVGRRRGPVLVTSHRGTRLPTVAVCRTSPALLHELIGELSPATADRLGETGVSDLFGRHGGNVRDALRELYDRTATGEFGIAPQAATTP
ncbi:MAG: hypothetical protein AAF710_08975 [Planctomycetota bacterium]